ncbi:hypothetical protein JCM10207_002408 [Rhodosporidiobolus poonsookiae]
MATGKSKEPSESFRLGVVPLLRLVLPLTFSRRQLDLPPELVDQILSYDNLDEKDLAHACLANKALLAHAQPLLFSEVKLSFVEDVTHLGQYFLAPAASKLFKSTEELHLASAVKSVRLLIDAMDPDLVASRFNLPVESKFEEYELPETWILQHEVNLGKTTSDFFSRLPNLASLEVRTDTPGTPDLSFLSDIEVPSIHQLNASDTSPTLISRLENLESLTCSFPFDFGTLQSESWPDAPALRHVSLSVSVEGRMDLQALYESFAWLLLHSYNSLRKLSLPLNKVFIVRLSDFTHFEILRITLWELGAEADELEFPIASFLDLLPPSLRHLEIDDYRTPPTVGVPLDKTYLAHLPPHLTSLAFDGLQFHPNAVRELIQNINSRLPSLKRLHIRGRPRDSFDFLMMLGSRSLWTDTDWHKLPALSEEKGIQLEM